MHARTVPRTDIHIIRTSLVGKRLVLTPLSISQEPPVEIRDRARLRGKSHASEELRPNNFASGPQHSMAHADGNYLGGICDVANEAVKSIPESLSNPVQQRRVDRLLGLEVPEGTETDVCGLGDLIDRHTLHPLLRHQPEGCFQEPGTGSRAFGARREPLREHASRLQQGVFLTGRLPVGGREISMAPSLAKFQEEDLAITLDKDINHDHFVNRARRMECSVATNLNAQPMKSRNATAPAAERSEAAVRVPLMRDSKAARAINVANRGWASTLSDAAGVRWERELKPYGLQLSPCVLALLAATTLAGCNDRAANSAKPPTLVRTEIVRLQDRQTSVALTGEVQARIQTDLSFRVSGRVITRLVDVGAHVNSGDLLARLDPAEQQADLDAATASLAAAKSQVRVAASTFERQKTLLAEGFTTQAAFDQAQEGLRTAEGSLESAKAQLGRSIEAMGDTELRASAAGVITARNLEVGQVMEAAQSAFTLAQDGDRDAVFDVYESIFFREPEDEIALTLLSDRRVTAVGRVREVSPAVNSKSSTVRVKVAIEKSAGGDDARQRRRRHRPMEAGQRDRPAMERLDGDRFGARGLGCRAGDQNRFVEAGHG